MILGQNEMKKEKKKNRLIKIVIQILIKAKMG